MNHHYRSFVWLETMNVLCMKQTSVMGSTTKPVIIIVNSEALLHLLLYRLYNRVWVLASSIGSAGFVTLNFSVGGAIGPRLNPQPGGLHFVWPLPLDLSGMGGPTRSLRSRQHSSTQRFIQTKYDKSLSFCFF
jgi:hypothetical protein